MAKASGKPQQPNSGRATNSPDPSRTKVWVTLPGKEKPAEVLAEGKENTKQVVEKGSYKYWL